MSEIYNAAGILNTVVILLVLAGGYIALRSGKHQKTGEIQGQVIEALKAELETLQRRMDRLEKENTRLTQTIGLIKSALSHRGMIITIDGDLVTISDNKGSIQSARIQEEL
jgi:cell division protein FtsB